jgi:hypothetical protein
LFVPLKNLLTFLVTIIKAGSDNKRDARIELEIFSQPTADPDQNSGEKQHVLQNFRHHIGFQLKTEKRTQ